MSQERAEFAADQEPLVNIGAVSRLTGVPESTLRAWERRYGFPEPERTAGGHRLYSRREVRRLQWVQRQTEAGTRISEAIRALRQSESGVEPAGSTRQDARRANDRETLQRLRERLVGQLLNRDADGSDQALAEALPLFPLETLLLDLVVPALSDIGDAWSEGRADVPTEHFASNHLRHHLLMWLRAGPPTHDVAPVVLACAPGELHEGSLLVLAVLLRRLRWPFIFLGQTTPLQALEAFLKDVNAAVVVFVAMTGETAAGLLHWPLWLPDAVRNGRPHVLFGGRAFVEQPDLALHVPGDYLGDSLREGIERLDGLLHDFNPSIR